MREQRGFGTSTQMVPRQTGNHHAGLHPEDVPQQTDDWIYKNPSGGSSTRRYQRTIQRATPRRIIRITTHEGAPIQRASKLQPQTRPDPPQEYLAPGRKPRQHCLFYVGLCLCMMLLGGILVNIVINWVHVTWDDWHYGRPRTYQTDADVGHGGVSHFTVENLGGHIFVIEIPVNDPKKYHLYVGPAITGGDASLAAATISFKDGRKGDLPDMVITVNGAGTYVFVNTKDGFKPQSEQGG